VTHAPGEQTERRHFFLSDKRLLSLTQLAERRLELARTGQYPHFHSVMGFPDLPGHVVERVAQKAQLVFPAHGHSTRVVAGRDVV